MITATTEGTNEKVNFFHFSYDDGKFILDPSKTIPLKKSHILSIIANDINNDNHLDVIITIMNQETNTREVLFYLYNQSIDNFTKYFTLEINDTNIFVADLNGDNLLDTIYFDKTTNSRKYVYFNGNKPIV